MTDTITSSVAVLLACHNRVEKTLRCLNVVFEQASTHGINLVVYLVDDGSTDGTADAVRSQYPQVELLIGDGSLFWNRGMHLAFGKALEKGFEYYLWLNDDTHLHQGAIHTLLMLHQELAANGKPNSIVITSTKDPENGAFTYGGYNRIRPLNPVSLSLIPPSNILKRCDTFCGNCVLIPKQVTDIVGNIDPVYLHRWGDVDYGLRALEKNCYTWVAPGYLADCEGNVLADKWRDGSLPIRDRIRELHSLKGLGKQDWLQFMRRHGGILWPVFWVRPYIRIAYDTLKYLPVTMTQWKSKSQ